MSSDRPNAAKKHANSYRIAEQNVMKNFIKKHTILEKEMQVSFILGRQLVEI